MNKLRNGNALHSATVYNYKYYDQSNCAILACTNYANYASIMIIMH